MDANENAVGLGTRSSIHGRGPTVDRRRPSICEVDSKHHRAHVWTFMRSLVARSLEPNKSSRDVRVRPKRGSLGACLGGLTDPGLSF